VKISHDDTIGYTPINVRGPCERIVLPAGTFLLRAFFAPLAVAIASPVALYLITLTVFLFRPPVLEFHFIDRVVFCALVVLVAWRGFLSCESWRRDEIAWPMAGLTALAIASLASKSFVASDWSAVAAKYIVPFSLFFLAGLVFRGESALRWLERFLLAVLAYLSFTAIAFFLGAHELVFPRFILDESIGIHADRARGPFLQAVANGLTINLLGLLALDFYRSKRLRGIGAFFLLSSLPLAIVATKTRSVWLSFAASIVWFAGRLKNQRLRRGLITWVLVGLVAAAAAIAFGGTGSSLQDRLREDSPVQFRIAAYHAGWEMFLERPFLGWGTGELQGELARRISGFRGETFAVHNTYFDVLLEQGLVGLLLYLWLVVTLFRLGRRPPREADTLVGSLADLWPLLLCVYFVNASFVVMNYQFVNGLVFTFAGILSAHAAPRAGERLSSRSF
jgi:putative inorganic carbon (HCO3(-)) transporter